MKLGMVLTPLVAVTAAGWLGMEGYYLATGKCLLTSKDCSGDAAVAAPVLPGPTAAKPDGCCPSMSPVLETIPIALPTTGGSATSSDASAAPGAIRTGCDKGTLGAADGAVAPAAVRPTAACAPSDACSGGKVPAATSPTSCAPTDCAPTDCPPSDCAPSDDCVPSDCAPGKAGKTAKQATGLATPAMDCEPTDCDDQGGCCAGEVAPVDTQAPTKR
ncbi:MAG: hypothetical protein KF878_32010 [Planctomycetes bacterium]|nr:hypothetical protein [Planctomycetota bacterium]